MSIEIGRLLWIIIIGVGGFKILMGLPFALCGRNQFAATINTPKKKVSIYFILGILIIQYVYLHFFSPSEIVSALEFSFVIGMPVGILGIVLYSWALKRKKEGKTISPWVEDEEKEIKDMLTEMQKKLPTETFAKVKEEAKKEFKVEYADIYWKDYLNNALGFSVIFLAVYIFFTDFFNVTVRIFY